MPRGGRRHAKSAARLRAEGTFRADRHAGRGEIPRLPPSSAPRPPKGLALAEREAWLELAAQVEALGTYDPSRFSAFRLTVKALALVYAAPPKLKATSMRGLISNASAMVARFGLDPVAIKAVDVNRPEAEPEEPDPTAEFGNGGAGRSLGLQ